MRVTLIQDYIFWADKTKNLQKTEHQLIKLKGKTDLVVLPEMFTTGFCTNQLELAEEMQGETVKKLCKWALDYNFAITGSFLARDNTKIFNRGFFVFPNGKIETADKRHLFTIGGENNHFEAGNKKLIVNYLGFNIYVLICYDLRFPVWSRNVNNEYDMLIYVANFPERRIHNWDILLKARAIENQSYVCGLNCIGEDGMGINYNGHSILFDFNATPLLSLRENETEISTYDLQIEPLIHFRNKFQFWKDADEFEIK